ncbi:hypothetical protein CSV77_15465 [Sporosarcina sp. P16b]|nr:hypothetical protein CSV77_15465 [Sporosarcina sp. P16b]
MIKISIFTVINLGMFFFLHLSIKLLSRYYISDKAFDFSSILLTVFFLIFLYCVATLIRYKLLKDSFDKKLFIIIFSIIFVFYVVFFGISYL